MTACWEVAKFGIVVLVLRPTISSNDVVPNHSPARLDLGMAAACVDLVAPTSGIDPRLNNVALDSSDRWYRDAVGVSIRRARSTKFVCQYASLAIVQCTVLQPVAAMFTGTRSTRWAMIDMQADFDRPIIN